MRLVYSVILAAAVAACVSFPAFASAITAVELRCEYREDPLGIDVTAPRLSWKLQGTGRNLSQSAYQILVASSNEHLEQNQGDLWDTGKIDSDESVLIPYAGAALASRQQCHWKVRVWDQDGAESDWSDAALWTMGLLESADWSAEWIGYDAEWKEEKPGDAEAPPTFDDASWIWDAENAHQSAPGGTVLFLKQVSLPETPRLDSALLYVTADNRADVFVNGRNALEGKAPVASFNILYAIDVTSFLVPGLNVIAVAATNEGNEANPAGMIAKLFARMADGNTIAVASDETWITHGTNAPKEWNQVGYKPEGWSNAVELGAYGSAPWNELKIGEDKLVLPPPPYLRAEFTAAPKLKRATLYATAYGLYEMHLNGQRVGDSYFTPGWTDYDKRLYYNTYDVTALVREDGANALGAILADGWYAGYIGFRLLSGLDRPRGYYEGEPRLRAQLEIEYKNGERQTVATTGEWKGAYGPIFESDMLMGEGWDLTRPIGAFAEPGYDDTAWGSVVTGTVESSPLQAHPGVPVKRFEEFTARSVAEVKPGQFVYDLGQNIVGWARITVQGEAGQRIEVRHAEMLQEDGTLYLEALRRARAMDTYILSGEKDTLEPKFTFHGFRYLEIRGLDKPVRPEDVVGVVLHSDIPRTGEFACSEPLLNQLHHNIVWGQKGNYLEVPTDCPQRDERLGWTGDANFFMPTSAYLADVGAFFTKWMVDLVTDGQMEDGSFPDIAPNIGLGGGNVAWGDAAMICTYLMHEYYGDKRIIEKHYDDLVEGMNYLEQTSENFIRSKVGYGDWLNLDSKTKDEVLATSYFAYLAQLMKEMAQIIGREDDAKKYAALEENVRAAFIENFVTDDGRILDSSQTGYALAFTMDLLPDALREAAAGHFVAELEKYDMHLATGFIGTPRLLPALSEAGERDIAYQLLLTKTYPSWLYQVTLGATTMWERWDGWSPEKGFQTPAMNSFNHYAFGAVGQYLYEDVGGIRRGAPSFRKIIINPVPGGGLTFAKCSYDSIRGKIVSNWEIRNDTLYMNVLIPPNTTAEIHVPAPREEAVTRAADIPFQEMRDGHAVFMTGSGDYRFEVPYGG